MKKFKKIAIISFLCLFIVSIYSIANAEVREIEFKPNIDIPGFEGKVTFGDSTTENIAKYVKAIYDYGISIGAILATVVLMAAGLIWLTSGGSQDKIGQAKNMISGSIIGLVLLFGSYTILNLVNPELVDFHIQDISNIDNLSLNYGCCQLPEKTQTFQGNTIKINEAKMSIKSDCENDDVNGRWFENRAPNIRPFSAAMTNQSYGFANACVQRTGCCSIVAAGMNWLGGTSTFTWTFPSMPNACYSGGYDLGVTVLNSTYTNELCEYSNVSDCSHSANGTQCYDDKNYLTTCAREGACGFCYYGSCINTLGREGDICGKGTLATCKSTCVSEEVEDNSARRCADDLKCCKY